MKSLRTPDTRHFSNLEGTGEQPLKFIAFCVGTESPLEKRERTGAGGNPEDTNKSTSTNHHTVLKRKKDFGNQTVRFKTNQMTNQNLRQIKNQKSNDIYQIFLDLIASRVLPVLC